MKNKLLIIELLHEYELYKMTSEHKVGDIYDYLVNTRYNKVNQQLALICFSVYRALSNT